jgi:hypothetical protein
MVTPVKEACYGEHVAVAGNEIPAAAAIGRGHQGGLRIASARPMTSARPITSSSMSTAANVSYCAA